MIYQRHINDMPDLDLKEEGKIDFTYIDARNGNDELTTIVEGKIYVKCILIALLNYLYSA